MKKIYRGEEEKCGWLIESLALCRLAGAANRKRLACYEIQLYESCGEI